MLCAVLLGGTSTLFAGEGGVQTYAVTVTNVTRGQILSPPLVIAHGPGFKLFEPGEPATPELAQLAEDAVAGPLMALLGTMPSVLDYDLGGGVILPGESLTVEIDTRGRFGFITVAGMLVTTNDAFYSGRTSVFPRGTMPSFAAIAWDAGSEGNTESCDHIPGPPCGNPLVRFTDTAEGFVHVHAGIQGAGSLATADYDWRNPTAYVTVRRVR
jgi:hypothetical protein